MQTGMLPKARLAAADDRARDRNEITQINDGMKRALSMYTGQNPDCELCDFLYNLPGLREFPAGILSAH
jgi:hypothetical protein